MFRQLVFGAGNLKLVRFGLAFFDSFEKEVRAWTIPVGTKAPQAAGEIHIDIESSFIRAEIVSYDDLINAGSMTAAKEKGLTRLEGKYYAMQEGDVVNFRFNVDFNNEIAFEAEFYENRLKET